MKHRARFSNSSSPGRIEGLFRDRRPDLIGRHEERRRELIGLRFFLLRAGAGVGSAKIYVGRLVDICFPAVQHVMCNLVRNGKALAMLVMVRIDTDHDRSSPPEPASLNSLRRDPPRRPRPGCRDIERPHPQAPGPAPWLPPAKGPLLSFRVLRSVWEKSLQRLRAQTIVSSGSAHERLRLPEPVQRHQQDYPLRSKATRPAGKTGAPAASSSSPAFPSGEDNSESISTSSAPAISESVCNVGRCLPLSIFAMEPRVRPQRSASSVCESPISRRLPATFCPTRS